MLSLPRLRIGKLAFQPVVSGQAFCHGEGHSVLGNELIGRRVIGSWHMSRLNSTVTSRADKIRVIDVCVLVHHNDL